MTFDPTQDESAAADNGEALPARLRADLARLHPVPAVPSGVDAAVRAAGRAYLARQRRVRLWTRAGAAIAATIVTCVGLRLALPPAGPGEAGPGVAGGSAPAGRPPVAARLAAAPAGPADVDGNGVIDVLDALVVARGVKAGRQDPAWDVTGDGVVDRRDVDVIAATAVRVGGRPQ